MGRSRKTASEPAGRSRAWILAAGIVLAATGGFAENTPSDWRITVTGVRTDSIESADMEEAGQHASHRIRRELESKGVVDAYEGLPFSMAVAMADGTDAAHPFRFDDELWDAGYDITLVSADGYAATFNTADVSHDALLLSVSKAGNPTVPSIVGDVPKGLWVKGIVAIELDLKSQDQTVEKERRAFRLILDLAGREYRFSLAELEALPYYVEERGSYTTSAGTTVTGLWGGIRFADLLNRYLSLKKTDPVTIEAMDGYQVTYGAEEILDETDGVWILAFRKDGEFLPEDPGYIRTIKVGPGVPDIDGHSSARMVARIAVGGAPYRDFSLSMEGLMSFSLDRKTIQTGISCHKRTVTFEWKGETAVYSGIALWRLLAFSDDPRYAPHKQDEAILSYQEEAARKGYGVQLVAADGYSITLDSRQLDGNDDVVLAMYRGGEELSEPEWPLMLVWDRESTVVPEGARPIRQVTAIRLFFEEDAE